MHAYQYLDFERRGIIMQRVEGTRKDMHRTSMHKIAEDMNRSPKTVNDHIKNHNREVRKRGYCTRCRRVKGNYDHLEV